MMRGRTATRLIGLSVGPLLGPLAALISAGSAMAQTPPPAGWSLALAAGPNWSSNPEDLPGKRKGDLAFGLEAALGHRWNLWPGGALTLSATGFSELYFRDAGGGVNRLSGTAILSQTWQGTSVTLGFSARTSMDQQLTRHDSASQELSFGLSRALALAPDWTLTPQCRIVPALLSGWQRGSVPRPARRHAGAPMGRLDVPARRRLRLCP
jgi:hypothetical protein